MVNLLPPIVRQCRLPLIPSSKIDAGFFYGEGEKMIGKIDAENKIGFLKNRFYNSANTFKTKINSAGTGNNSEEKKDKKHEGFPIQK